MWNMKYLYRIIVVNKWRICFSPGNVADLIWGEMEPFQVLVSSKCPKGNACNVVEAEVEDTESGQRVHDEADVGDPGEVVVAEFEGLHRWGWHQGVAVERRDLVAA